MDWIPSLLKHLSISRSAIVAVFITAMALYVGPRVAPAYFDVVPAPWLIVLQAALIFSGCLVFFWAGSSIFSSIQKTFIRILKNFRSSKLSETEVGLLCEMGKRPSDSVNIEDIDYDNPACTLTELELLHVLENLVKKELIVRNSFAPNLYYLTSRGREVALKNTRRVGKRGDG